MRIIIDGDACPSKGIIKDIAKEYNIEIHLFVDTSHFTHDPEMTIHVVSKGKDAVDLAIFQSLEPNDLVITQDYGLAALVLTKTSAVVNPLGFIYSNHNIDELLLRRHIAGEARRSGKYSSSRNKKRTPENDIALREVLIRLIQD